MNPNSILIVLSIGLIFCGAGVGFAYPADKRWGWGASGLVILFGLIALGMSLGLFGR